MTNGLRHITFFSIMKTEAGTAVLSEMSLNLVLFMIKKMPVKVMMYILCIITILKKPLI